MCGLRASNLQRKTNKLIRPISDSAPTVVPEAPSVALARPVRDAASAVDGRVALFERFGATVVDALVAVDGREANR